MEIYMYTHIYTPKNTHTYKNIYIHTKDTHTPKDIHTEPCNHAVNARNINVIYLWRGILYM